MINAAILCRVSTEGQRENTSLAEQRRILTDLADRQGWTWEVFEEVESGAAGIANRPVLAQLLGRIASGEFQRLVVLVQDRLSRAGVGELEQISAVLARVGARLVTQSGEFDPANADHTLITDINAVVAKRERAAIRERTLRGREAVAKAGGFSGHPVPFGWRRIWAADGTTRFEVDPAEGEAVRALFERYAAGGVGTSILSDEFGLPQTTIAQMLRSPRYAGMELWRRNSDHGAPVMVDSAAWPAIVSRDLWERVQGVMASRAGKATGGRSPWPLSGILRCRWCGGAMQTVTVRQSLTYYKCRSRSCASPQYIRATDAHAAVLGKLRSVLRWWGEVTADRDDDTAERLASMRSRLDAVEREEVDLWDQRQAGMDSSLWRRLSERAAERRRVIEGEMAQVQAAAQRARPDATSLGEAIDVIAPELLRTGDRDQMRAVFRLVFAEVSVLPSRATVRRGTQTVAVPYLHHATLVDGSKWPRR